MITWHKPETAPKDGTQILAAFKTPSYSMPLMAVWGGANEKWCAAALIVNIYDGEWSDWYFEFKNVYYDDDELEAWAEAPITRQK